MKGLFRRLRASWAGEALRFARYVVSRFNEDRCMARAGALSYTSLLAIVPLVALFLSIMSAFPFFARLRARAEAEIAGLLLPHAEDAVVEQLGTFVEKAAGLTGFGVIGLAVTAVLLLNTINHAFSRIWRVSRMRPLVVRLLAYWTIISLGPLLFGGSLWLSGVLYGTGASVGGSGFQVAARVLAPLLPFLLEAAAFALLYIAVPNCHVRRRDAAIGGVIAALLFEALSRAFTLYVTYFPSYETIYGALSAIPFFLIWMYASWAVALFGAEVTAALPEWRRMRHEPGLPLLS